MELEAKEKANLLGLLTAVFLFAIAELMEFTLLAWLLTLSSLCDEAWELVVRLFER